MKKCGKNLYINRENEKFVYLLGISTYKITDFYKRKNNLVLPATTEMVRSSEDEVGLYKYSEYDETANPNKIKTNYTHIQQLLQNSKTFNIEEYIKSIFSNNEKSIYLQSEKLKFTIRELRQETRRKKFKIPKIMKPK